MACLSAKLAFPSHGQGYCLWLISGNSPMEAEALYASALVTGILSRRVPHRKRAPPKKSFAPKDLGAQNCDNEHSKDVMGGVLLQPSRQHQDLQKKEMEDADVFQSPWLSWKPALPCRQ